MKALLPACLLAAALTPAALAQSVPVAREVSAGHYDVLVAAPGAPAQTVLADVEFLPLQLAGFAVRDRLSNSLALPADSAPAPHVRLAEGGSLYLARGGGATSLLHVRADGSAAVLFSRPDAVGPSLAGLVHKARNAPLVLLATTAAAGGEAWLVSLAGAPPRLLSAPGTPPADPLSLRVSAGRAFFVAGGTLRAARLGLPGRATSIPLGAAADVTQSELALSADGLSVAAISQAPGGLRLVHVVDEALQAHQITPAPGVFDTPHYDSPFGPWLALSADGSQVAWRATIAGAAEAFVKDVPNPAPAVQVTADANFVDTLDNVGVLGFAAGDKLLFIAGELKTGGIPGQLDGGDVYVALPGAGGSLSVTNATGTSGDFAAPFTAGELEILDQALDPSSQTLLMIIDPNGADAALLAMPADGSGPGTLLLPSLEAVPEIYAAGDAVLVTSRACQSCGTTLNGLAPSGLWTKLLQLPQGLQVDRFAEGGGRAACVVSASPALQLPLRIDLSTGALDLPWPIVGAVSENLALTEPTGDLVLGVGAAGGPQLLLQLDGTLSGHVVKVPVGTLIPLDL